MSFHKSHSTNSISKPSNPIITVRYTFLSPTQLTNWILPSLFFYIAVTDIFLYSKLWVWIIGSYLSTLMPVSSVHLGFSDLPREICLPSCTHLLLSFCYLFHYKNGLNQLPFFSLSSPTAFPLPTPPKEFRFLSSLNTPGEKITNRRKDLSDYAFPSSSSLTLLFERLPSGLKDS